VKGDQPPLQIHLQTAVPRLQVPLQRVLDICLIQLAAFRPLTEQVLVRLATESSCSTIDVQQRDLPANSWYIFTRKRIQRHVVNADRSGRYHPISQQTGLETFTRGMPVTQTDLQQLTRRNCVKIMTWSNRQRFSRRSSVACTTLQIRDTLLVHTKASARASAMMKKTGD